MMNVYECNVLWSSKEQLLVQYMMKKISLAGVCTFLSIIQKVPVLPLNIRTTAT